MTGRQINVVCPGCARPVRLHVPVVVLSDGSEGIDENAAIAGLTMHVTYGCEASQG